MFDNPSVILKKIQLGEDNSLELKGIYFKGEKIIGRRRDDLADEIAAIANTHDAVLLLGADDKTKDITGIPIDKLDKVEEFIRDICNDTIKPPVMIRTFRIELPNAEGIVCPVLKVDIPRSLFVHQSPGGYFYRQGSSKRQMQPDFLARLFQQRSQARLIRFEEQYVPETSLENMSPLLWNRFTVRFEGDPKSILIKRNLLTKTEMGDIRVSVAGVLMCCENPEQYIPCAYIEAVRYRGLIPDSNYQIDAQKITGPLDRQIDLAMHFYRKNQTIASIKTPQRMDIPQYDERAVFESIVNAVAHRDYAVYGSKIRLFMFDDRMEIYSPGALPNTVSIENIELRQVTRNELITSLLTDCPLPGQTAERRHYMEKRGEGVPIIFSTSQKISGKKPKYTVIDDTELLLTIFAATPPEQV